MSTYEAPVLEVLDFNYQDVVVASGMGIAKNGGHQGCTMLPNGKPIPPHGGPNH